MPKQKSPEIGEGLLFDLLTKRRAGKFTAAEILWAADNMDKVRPLMALSAGPLTGSFQELLAACHQDWRNPYITEEHFPLVDDGTGGKEILEYGFDRAVTGYEAEKALKAKGYKLVGMRRAMEYVAAHPDAQKTHPLIVLGAQWRYADGIGVPDLHWGSGKRRFDLVWMSDEFGTRCRFLVVRDKEEGEPKKHVIDTDADPFIPVDWKVESHQKRGQMEWDPAKVSLYLSPRQQGCLTIGGHDLREEFKSQPVLNACVLDYLLAHPEFIPEEWKGKYVYFWGTIYCNSKGQHYVRCLYWRGGRWDWNCRLLDDNWYDFYPIAVSASVTA